MLELRKMTRLTETVRHENNQNTGENKGCHIISASPTKTILRQSGVSAVPRNLALVSEVESVDEDRHLRLQDKLLDRRERERATEWLTQLKGVFGEPIATEFGPAATSLISEGLRRKPDAPVVVRVSELADLPERLSDLVVDRVSVTGVDSGLPIVALCVDQFLRGISRFPFSFEDLIMLSGDGRLLFLECPDQRQPDQIEARDLGMRW